MGSTSVRPTRGDPNLPPELRVDWEAWWAEEGSPESVMTEAELSRFFFNSLDFMFFHSPVQGPANVLWKMPDSNYFRLCSHAVSTTTSQLCPCSPKAVTGVNDEWMAEFQHHLVSRNRELAGHGLWAGLCWPGPRTWEDSKYLQSLRDATSRLRFGGNL